MSIESLIKLSRTLSRQNRADVLRKLNERSHRNIDLAEELGISQGRVSEALTDLVASHLVIWFEREAIDGERHTIYVISPFGSEILTTSDEMDPINKKLYLFCWDKIPGNDSGLLTDFLKQKFSIDWVKTAKIEKIDNDKTIKIYTGKNFIFLKLDNDKDKLLIEIDGRTHKSHELIAERKNDKIKIYKFPEKITDFGAGIEYILRYSLEADFKVNYKVIIRKFIITMDIEKRTPCEKKNCEIYCQNLIENIAKRFGEIPQSYLFSWDEITGNDSGKLIDFLKSNYDVDWVKTDKITKTNNSKTITITAGKNVISLNLNDKNTELNLEIDNVKTDKFIVKTEKGKLNIYNKQFKKVDPAKCSFKIELIRK